MLVQTCRHFSVRTDLISGDTKFIMLQTPYTVYVTALRIECNRITFGNVTDVITAGMSVLANRVTERYWCG
jgi:hypothetical protein